MKRNERLFRELIAPSHLERRLAGELGLRDIDVVIARDGVYVTGYGRLVRLYDVLTGDDEGEIADLIETIRTAINEADAAARRGRRGEP